MSIRNLAFASTVLAAALPAVGLAHSIDYLASSISPAASFNGASNNFTVWSPVNPGTTIQFSLTYAITSNGNTTAWPRTVSFGATTASKPSGASDPAVSPLQDCTFAGMSSTCTQSVSIAAPFTAGAYSVKILPTSGTGGPSGLSSGGGIAVHFSVGAGGPASLLPTVLSLTPSQSCLTYKNPEATLVTAMLTSGGSGVSNKYVKLTLDGEYVGEVLTDAVGRASFQLNTASLAVGDHNLLASFEEDAQYKGSADGKTLGITYVFVGYQQPINADGSSVFGGRSIPVKIRIADSLASSVSNAEAHVYFAFGTPSIIGTEAEPVGNSTPDNGNRMRYDLLADQYVYNWDVGGLPNGTYTVRVDLNEGSCGSPHIVTLSQKRKK